MADDDKGSVESDVCALCGSELVTRALRQRIQDLEARLATHGHSGAESTMAMKQRARRGVAVVLLVLMVVPAAVYWFFDRASSYSLTATLLMIVPFIGGLSSSGLGGSTVKNLAVGTAAGCAVMAGALLLALVRDFHILPGWQDLRDIVGYIAFGAVAGLVGACLKWLMDKQGGTPGTGAWTDGLNKVRANLEPLAQIGNQVKSIAFLIVLCWGVVTGIPDALTYIGRVLTH